jgi:hypothetical protein
MPLKKQPQSLRSVVDRISEELQEVISAEVERRVTEAIKMFRAEMRAAASDHGDQRRGGRLCPVAGCGKPGAGPRNRWFCREHAQKLSVEEMRGIAERNKRHEVEGKLPTKVSEERVVRLPPKKLKTPRTLDMSCRVEGCTNRSRGPRSGFICDTHRAQLTREEQLAAREQYKLRLAQKPVEAPRAQLPPAPVPPIVRKAEPAAESA